MTATAMILGVVPMALGTAEGGEQNAPLGRAVIGGLLFGTIASLFVVPVAFDFVCSRFGRRAATEAGLPVTPSPEAAPHRQSLNGHHPAAHAAGGMSSNGHVSTEHKPVEHARHTSA